MKLTATIIGSGPNGLAAAVVLARAGIKVKIVEGSPLLGGGLRTQPFGPQGFVRDVCSAVHPLVLPSPFFRALDVINFVTYKAPFISYAHTLKPGEAVFAYRDIERTADELGPDGRQWRKLLGPLSENIQDVFNVSFHPILHAITHPVASVRLGRRVVEQSGFFRDARWRENRAPALLAGVAAHAATYQPSFAAASVGLVLAASAHADGWPIPIGGAQMLARFLIADIETHGGHLETGRWITSIEEASADIVLADTSAKSLAEIARPILPEWYRRKLQSVRYGMGITKIDLAIDGTIPWTDTRLLDAGTIHIGGSANAVHKGENEIFRGHPSAKPFVLVSQPGAVDADRAPIGKSVLWAYAHTVSGDPRNHAEKLLTTIEDHAPGLRDRVLSLKYTSAADIARENPNYVGGDIASGLLDTHSLLARPTFGLTPWRTPVKGLYFASAGVSPGPGVHGMSGFLAACTALKDFGIPLPDEFKNL